MDGDIKSQIERAKELLTELEKSANTDLSRKEVSDRTRNLTQEILVKMRSIFDQSMYKFFEKSISSKLSDEEKERAKVYFPIISKKTDLTRFLVEP